METKYHCDCKEHCGGQQREVSKTTYYRHKPFRNHLSHFSSEMRDFLSANPIVVRTSSSSSDAAQRSAHTAGPSNENTYTTSGRPNKRTCYSGGEISRTVRVWSLGGCTVAIEFTNRSTQHDVTLGSSVQSDRLHTDPESGILPDAPQSGSIEPSGATPAEDLDHHLDPVQFDLPPGDVEDLWLQDIIHLDNLKTAVDFVKALQDATLDDATLGMSDEALHRLRNPLREHPDIDIDKHTRLAIRLYLANPSDMTYEANRAPILDCFPGADIPSYYRIKRLVADMTGVESIIHHMCVNSCIAYTGPFLDLQVCPVCSEPRYDQFRFQTSSGWDRIPRQEFHTIPIGPQLQALYRSPESASQAHYLREERSRVLAHLELDDCMDEYSDLLHGTDFIAAFRDGRIEEDDIVLMFSIDGAQLYAKKVSACWIYIWVLVNLSPSQRYKKRHVFIGGFIPGPNNPKNLDSFLFPGLQHLAGIQREGLRIWDAAFSAKFSPRFFLH